MVWSGEVLCGLVSYGVEWCGMVYCTFGGNGKCLMPFPSRLSLGHLSCIYSLCIYEYLWRPQMKIQFTRPLTITSTSAFQCQGCPHLVPEAPHWTDWVLRR